MSGTPIEHSPPRGASQVARPDMELWLTSYVRACAAVDGHTVTVSNKEPPTLSSPLPQPLIIIRDDGGRRLSQVTFDCSIGASVLAGTKQNDKTANDLARWLAALLHDLELPALAMPASVPPTPIVDVVPDGCNGPTPVTELVDIARRYLTAQYVITGVW